MAKIVDIGFRIKKINDLLCKKADETMQKMGVTFSQHHALVYLHHQENQRTSLKNMERHFHVSQATMAGIVKRLEEKKLVDAYTSENDKRVKMVVLTEKGEEICQKSRALMQKSEMKMRSLYSEEEMEQFDIYLDRLLEQLNQEEK